jgi:hypothetical protein
VLGRSQEISLAQNLQQRWAYRPRLRKGAELMRAVIPGATMAFRQIMPQFDRKDRVFTPAGFFV